MKDRKERFARVKINVSISYPRCIGHFMLLRKQIDSYLIDNYFALIHIFSRNTPYYVNRKVRFPAAPLAYEVVISKEFA